MTRIVIDARPAVDPHRTGVGHYTDALLRALPPCDEDCRFVAWYLDLRGIGSRRRRFAGAAPNLRERATRLPSRPFAAVGSRLGLPRVEWLAGGFDLLLATNYLPPPTASDAVVLVVHDLAFEVMPETAPHHDARWRRRFDRWLDRAAAIIVPSEATKRDLVRVHDVPEGRIDVVLHGTDAEAFRPSPPVEVEDVRRRYGIDGPYVVFLGGLEPRKNLEGLVAAFAMLEDRRAALVVAGGAVRWAPDYAQRVDAAIASLPAQVRERVIRTGYVPDADRRALLSGAEVLAYPSRYEGFGFPVLEGFAANVPVLTSATSSLPEVAGDAAVLVDPDDPAAIARGLDELLGDEDLRNILRAAGTVRVATFTWERAARETAAVLRRALEAAR
ncbi:MAG: glycosyltransferase family 4 protein [Planctomycetaceae bacterium]